MLALIAWRNVWRSRVRSLTVIFAIALGLGAGVFLMGFSWGMNDQRARNIIETQISHIQFHHPEFKEEMKMKYFIPEGPAKLAEVSRQSGVTTAAGRLLANGMLSSPKGGFGVQIHGIDPEAEALLTQLDQRIVAGTYLADTRSNPVIIGDKLAEKLGFKIAPTDEHSIDSSDAPGYRLRKKVVLTFLDAKGNTSPASFRVVGVYKSLNSKFDETNVFVPLDVLQRIAGAEGQIHEIALLIDDAEQVPAFKDQYSQTYPDLQVEDWMDLAPDLKLVAETFDTTMYIFIGIILLALAFAIINTMLMAVLERTRELGMLMSVGMNKGRVFLMVMLETVFMALIGGPLGLWIGYGFVRYFGSAGIELSAFAEGAASMGLESTVYTSLDTHYYFQIALMVVITAILSSVYPALKALRLKPAEAVRAI